MFGRYKIIALLCSVKNYNNAKLQQTFLKNKHYDTARIQQQS